MNCSEYLVDFLIRHGVTDVFGYAGGYIVPFMDALYKRKDEIKTHVCYNEQGCAFAAVGFARTSGRMGVYFTTSGPGAVNGLSGLADASMTRNISKYSVTANSSEGFSDVINRAYNMANLGRKGGVVIDFPLNIQQADITCR